jgi:hypothetical protein
MPAQAKEAHKSQGQEQQLAQDKSNAIMECCVHLVKEHCIESFTSLPDVNPVMDHYQKHSGCHLAIQLSNKMDPHLTKIFGALTDLMHLSPALVPH